MATEGTQTQAGPAVLAKSASPLSAGSRPSREAKHANNGQEVWRDADQMCQSKQSSGPSLPLCRKSSCDSGEGTVLDQKYECHDYSSEVISTKEKPYPELSTGKKLEEMIPVLRKSSEESLCQLDTTGDSVDAGTNRTGSTHCSCTQSSHYTNANTYYCHSSSSSPVHSPCLSCRPSGPKYRHIRRGSLPVSMLAFHKVIKQMVLTRFYSIFKISKAHKCKALLHIIAHSRHCCVLFSCFMLLDIALPLIPGQFLKRTELFDIISI